jgi:hypothetical protein
MSKPRETVVITAADLRIGDRVSYRGRFHRVTSITDTHPDGIWQGHRWVSLATRKAEFAASLDRELTVDADRPAADEPADQLDAAVAGAVEGRRIRKAAPAGRALGTGTACTGAPWNVRGAESAETWADAWNALAERRSEASAGAAERGAAGVTFGSYTIIAGQGSFGALGGGGTGLAAKVDETGTLRGYFGPGRAYSSRSGYDWQNRSGLSIRAGWTFDRRRRHDASNAHDSAAIGGQPKGQGWQMVGGVTAGRLMAAGTPVSRASGIVAWAPAASRDEVEAEVRMHAELAGISTASVRAVDGHVCPDDCRPDDADGLVSVCVTPAGAAALDRWAASRRGSEDSMREREAVERVLQTAEVTIAEAELAYSDVPALVAEVERLREALEIVGNGARSVAALAREALAWKAQDGAYRAGGADAYGRPATADAWERATGRSWDDDERGEV